MFYTNIRSPVKLPDPPNGYGCKPKVAVVLKGTLDSVSACGLALTVGHSNRFGHAYLVESQPLAVGVSEASAIRRQGRAALAGNARPRGRSSA